MKKLTQFTLCLATLLLVLFPIVGLSSCGKSEADAGELLAMVPSDAGAVAVVNVRSLLEKGGAKFDGNSFAPTEEMLRAAATDSTNFFAEFIEGKSGIEPACAVIFSEGEGVFCLAPLADPASFKKVAAERLGTAFVSSEGVEVCRNFAVKGNTVWGRLDRQEIRPDEVNRFSSLSSSQSILSVKNASRLAEFSADIEGWANIAALLNNSGMDFSSRGMTTMALQTLLKDPSDITFTATSEKGRMQIEATIIDSKGNRASLQIPTAEIDPETIAGISASGETVIACGVSQKLIKSLRKEVDNNGISMLGIIMQSLGSLDGTSAAVLGRDGNSLAGVISTTGENTLPLTNLLNESGLSVTVDGKLLRIISNDGQPSGPLNPSDIAPLFKKAMFGVVAAGSLSQKTSALKIDRTALMFSPDNGGLKLSMDIYAGSEKVQFMASLFEALANTNKTGK